MNYVTITSDASCGKKKDRTGFAYYIRDDSGTTAMAWAVNKKMDTFEAEMTAALAALKVVSERKYPEETTLIHYCDNMVVVQCLNDNFMKNISQQKYQTWINTIQNLTIQFEETVGLYVESHTKNDTGKLKRHYMNRWCDHNARSMMRYSKYHNKYKEIK